ncbi:hypothetical protein Tco_1562494 [Tanacetum coccineum]
MAYPLPLDTTYPNFCPIQRIYSIDQYGVFTSIEYDVSIIWNRIRILDILIRASRLKKVMADKGKKSSMETFAPNEKADYYYGITNHDELRIIVFPISLAGGARRWFDKTKESIICWVDLTAKFFRKYYPPSRIEGKNTPVKKWDPANPRFEGWLAIKFVNYKTMDIFTKGALWDYWKMGGDEIEVSDDESSDLEEY